MMPQLTQSTTSLIVFTACSAYYLCMVPLQWAFGQSWSDVLGLNLVVDGIAMACFFRRARSNFKEEDDWISRVKAVNERNHGEKTGNKLPVHKKMRFWIDVVIVFPFDAVIPLLSLLLPTIGNYLAGNSDYCNCNVQPSSILIPYSSGCYTRLRLIKIIGLFRLPGYFSALEQTLFDAIVPRMVFLLFFLFLCTHYTALGWVFIGHIEGFGTSDYGPPYGFNNEAVLFQYAKAIHWATLGQDDAKPSSTLQSVFSVFIVIVREGLSVAVVGQVASFISNYDNAAAAYRQKMLLSTQFMNTFRVPSDLSSRVLQYHQFNYLRTNGLSADEVLEGLNGRSRRDISYFLNGKVLRNVPMFQNTPENFVEELCGMLLHETYCPQEYVIKVGEVGRAMYVISSGRLSVIGSNGERFSVLRSGDYFGEIALIYSRKRTASVQALTFSDLNILSYDSFQHILDDYPEVVDMVTKSMGDRVVSMKNYRVEERKSGLKQARKHSTLQSLHSIHTFNDDDVIELTKRAVSPTAKNGTGSPEPSSRRRNHSVTERFQQKFSSISLRSHSGEYEEEEELPTSERKLEGRSSSLAIKARQSADEKERSKLLAATVNLQKAYRFYRNLKKSRNRTVSRVLGDAPNNEAEAAAMMRPFFAPPSPSKYSSSTFFPDTGTQPANPARRRRTIARYRSLGR